MANKMSTGLHTSIQKNGDHCYSGDPKEPPIARWLVTQLSKRKRVLTRVVRSHAPPFRVASPASPGCQSRWPETLRVLV